MNRNYYYLVAGLPDIIFENEQKSFDHLSIKNEVLDGVNDVDKKAIRQLYLPYDNENLIHLLLKKKDSLSNEFGSYTLEQFSEEPQTLPQYIQQFIELQKEQRENSTLPENELFALFYQEIQQSNNQFIRQWFAFDLNIRNILTAYTCRKKEIENSGYLVGENEFNNILKKSMAADFSLKGEYDYVDKLLVAVEEKNFLERERKLDLIRWNFAETLVEYDYFSINVLLSFLIKIQIVHRWKLLDTEKGKQIFAEMMSVLRSAYQEPTDLINKK